jgi:hypothetical protein
LCGTSITVATGWAVLSKTSVNWSGSEGSLNADIAGKALELLSTDTEVACWTQGKYFLIASDSACRTAKLSITAEDGLDVASFYTVASEAIWAS